MPLVLAAFGAGTVALTAAALVGRRWSNVVRLQYAALAVAVLALTLQLGTWRLIG